ncbi:hypothetical protein SEA_DARWIN_12 [Corynebacterium phage Darwin]|uniref:Uncharacterized protein n=1 Tax=Corynebacterium phage Darwin TaxID=2047869 RepID=A0A2H4P8R8_9CAUD|nr:hypothetical protein FDJ11_gp12 [Corynebacterium phage Darwin]ATW58623.1 hypothetical protein SEA_DARWIN_12 [Corynebacterium phage Darwin]
MASMEESGVMAFDNDPRMQ